ncbi:hypothetical protein SAMN05444273_101396 [Litoreibacter ascidiaceicola]|uniref:Uncharacterized protein n=1 Tax=Litoreibacter ascidiaceicola TaxID=1486859 RepID=A0A1M4TFB3_9RHOB|nr:hypothetical protein [Litoreibacter ascidiaceicola]SHE43024.1 hypothetical protein SAMN05444273_101396 [Litoreibacter ascidiaceicola]
MVNYEGQVIAIRRLSAEVDIELTKLLGRTEPMKAGTAAHADLARKIDQWRGSAAAMQKAVRSKEGLLNKSHGSSLKKHGNYEAKQSYASQMGNMSRLRKDLLALLNKIADLINAATTPVSDEVAIMNGVKSALKAITEGGDDIVLTQQQTQTLTAQISKASGPMESIEGYNPNQPVGLLTLALVMFVTAKKLLGRNSKA